MFRHFNRFLRFRIRDRKEISHSTLTPEIPTQYLFIHRSSLTVAFQFHFLNRCVRDTYGNMIPILFTMCSVQLRYRESTSPSRPFYSTTPIFPLSNSYSTRTVSCRPHSTSTRPRSASLYARYICFWPRVTSVWTRATKFWPRSTIIWPRSTTICSLSASTWSPSTGNWPRINIISPSASIIWPRVSRLWPLHTIIRPRATSMWPRDTSKWPCSTIICHEYTNIFLLRPLFGLSPEYFSWFHHNLASRHRRYPIHPTPPVFVDSSPECGLAPSLCFIYAPAFYLSSP